jgi:hypothetical protein
MFYEITKDEGSTLAGWEVHSLATVDNPFFGHVDGDFVVDNIGTRHGPFDDPESAAKDIRWERTAGQAIKENGWTEDDPDLLREWYARWVKSDARFVYAVHSIPLHTLLYAPARFDVDGFPDVQRAMLDLSGYDVDQRHATRRPYFLALGADLGTVDDFAFTLWAWSLKDPILYEVAAWKKPGLDYDEMEAYLHAVRSALDIGIVVADAGGGGKSAVKGWAKRWNARYGTPMLEAEKKPGYKPIAIKQMNNDIRRGFMRLREGSPLIAEMMVHRWSPLRSADGKLIEAASTANHVCLVAGTMIETSTGPRAIETLSAGDSVWTRAGLRPVTAAWCTGVRPTWTLKTDTGQLIGTNDHPVWTNDGWTDLALLTPDTTLFSWANMDRRLWSSSTVKDTVGIPSRKTEACESITVVVRAIGYIVTYGLRCAVRFLRAITSITSTKTRPIIELKTLSPSKVQSICDSTCENPNDLHSLGKQSNLLKPQPRPGTARPPVSPGTVKTRSRPWPMLLCDSITAWFVDAISNRNATQLCVATNVSPNSEGAAGSMTLNMYAQSAGVDSCETSTPLSKHHVVQSHVVSVVENERNELVYNLTVDGEHEYFANGTLVSNCDSALYAFLHSYHHRYREPLADPRPGSVEFIKREEMDLERFAIDGQFDEY